jgi:hypothetical protein
LKFLLTRTSIIRSFGDLVWPRTQHLISLLTDKYVERAGRYAD